NLDSAMGSTILELFRRLNREDGITVVIVTHDPQIAASTGRSVRVEDGLVHDVTAKADDAAEETAQRGDDDDDSTPDDHTTASDVPLLEYAAMHDGDDSDDAAKGADQ
nr:hypothetical protein [Deltaproteobacteria bacterium]